MPLNDVRMARSELPPPIRTLSMGFWLFAFLFTFFDNLFFEIGAFLDI